MGDGKRCRKEYFRGRVNRRSVCQQFQETDACMEGPLCGVGGDRFWALRSSREVGQISYWKHNHATLFRMPLDLKKELVTATPIRVLN